MMRRALEEDQYSALGSIVETDSSDDDEEYAYDPSAGRSGAIDKHVLQAAAKKYLRMDSQRSLKGFDPATFRMDADDYAEGRARASSPNKRPRGAVCTIVPEEDGRRRKKRGGGVSPVPTEEGAEEQNDASGGDAPPTAQPQQNAAAGGTDGQQQQGEEYFDGDEGVGEEEETSIFGATQGAKNATWVECDRCKKVRSWIKAWMSLAFHPIRLRYRSDHFNASPNLVSAVETTPRRRRRAQAPLEVVL